MAAAFKPAARYVRLPHNGRIYACEGIWAERKNVEYLSPEAAAQCLAEAGVDSPLVHHFGLTPGKVETKPVKRDERAKLEAEAARLGITVRRNMKTDTLRAKVEEARAAPEFESLPDDDNADDTGDTDNELMKLLKG